MVNVLISPLSWLTISLMHTHAHTNAIHFLFDFIYKCLSLDSAIDIDRLVATRKAARRQVPHSTFSPTLFRQPSLSEGPLKPALYRMPAHNAEMKRPATTKPQREKAKESSARSSVRHHHHHHHHHRQNHNQQQEQQQKSSSQLTLHQLGFDSHNYILPESTSVESAHRGAGLFDSPASSISSLQTIGSTIDRDIESDALPLSNTRNKAIGRATATNDESSHSHRHRHGHHSRSHSFTDNTDDDEEADDVNEQDYEDEDPEVDLDIHVNEILNSPTPFNRLSVTILSPFRSGAAGSTNSTSNSAAPTNNSPARVSVHSPLSGEGLPLYGSIKGQPSP